MGIIYCGPYADQIDSYSHEGYVARILRDGTETSSYSPAGELTSYRARCDCGWRAESTHPPTTTGEEAAEEQWNREHLLPMIDREAQRQTVTGAQLLAWIACMRERLQYEPDRTSRAGDPLFTPHSRGIADTLDALGDLLGKLTDQTRGQQR